MNHNELRIVRNTLNLSKEEAARYVAEMGVRQWENYERDAIYNYGVKPYITKKLHDLLEWRSSLIRNTLEESPRFLIYKNKAEYFEDYLEYKVHCSAMTTLNIDYKFPLIVFNEEEYLIFLENNGLKNDESSLKKWAGEKYDEIIKAKQLLRKIEENRAIQKTELLHFCLEIGFEQDAAHKFVNQSTTLSQKIQKEPEIFDDELTEFFVKRLPHTLFYAENEGIKNSLFEKTKNYIDILTLWGNTFNKTKGVIEIDI